MAAFLVSLGTSFDDNTKLLLQSDALKNNAVFKWQCKTTLPQHYLGPTSGALRICAGFIKFSHLQPSFYWSTFMSRHSVLIPRI